MTLIKWNTKTPSLFNEIDSFLTRPTLFNEIDRFFNSVSTQFPTKYEQSSSWVPQFEVLNTEKAYKNCALLTEIDEYLKEKGFTRVACKMWGNCGWGDAFYIKTHLI